MSELGGPTGPANTTGPAGGRRAGALRSVAELLPRWSEWKPALRAPGADLLAGLTVAIVALPLALGFGVSSGPRRRGGPGHRGRRRGARRGVRRFPLPGVGPDRGDDGGPGADRRASTGRRGVLTVGLMAGVMLVGLAFAGVGRAVRYMPAPVIEGFTAGIAVRHRPAAGSRARWGCPSPRARRSWQSPWRAARGVRRRTRDLDGRRLALVVAVVMLLGGRCFPTVPFSLVAVAAATVSRNSLDLDVARDRRPAVRVLPAPSLSFLHLGRSRPRCSRRPSPWPRWPHWNRCCRRPSPTR